MNLTSVKYRDSCIYIGLKRPQNGLDGRDAGAFLLKFRNAYVVYKIKAFDRQVRDTILIKKKDVSVAGSEIVLRFELSHLRCPEDSQIEIGTIKINFREEKSEILYINETYSLPEIRSTAPGKKKIVKNNRNLSKNKTFHIVEERYFNRNKGPKLDSSSTTKSAKNSKSLILTKSSKSDKLKESLTSQKKGIESQTNRFEEVSVATDSSTVIEETTPISTVVSEIEAEIESKLELDLETKKLDMDIRQLCYGTIDLLLSNLPLPEFNNERSPSNAMVRSIHRYINTDLLRQKESEEKGVESA